MTIAALQNVWKTYWLGHNRIDALKEVNLQLHQGDLIAVMGPSGSGKSTLLNILGCLDQPSEGQYLLGDRDVSDLDDNELSETRAGRIGFIFQSYNLISQLNVIENIETPLFYRGFSEQESYERAVELAERVGLGRRKGHVPTELSGGERQRVGIARALASNPLIVLADEPTGNLDTKTGNEILELLQDVNREGTTIVLVTHDPQVAEVAHQTAHMVDGELTVKENE
jgi:putative ABC transport system ATP-binding protein